MARITQLPVAAPLDGSETIPLVQDGVTRRVNAADHLAYLATGAELARDQAADLVLPANIFIDVPLATAEAGVPEGTTFKLVSSATGLSDVRIKNVGGSELLFQEATAASLAAADGASRVWWISSGVGATSRSLQSKLRDLPASVGDHAGLQQTVNMLSAEGGGTIMCNGRTIELTQQLIGMPNVKLDGEGGTLAFALSQANDCGVRAMSGFALRNASVIVDSLTVPSDSAGFHSPLLIGAYYGESPTAESISPFEGVSGIEITNVFLQTNADGKAAIQIIGGVSNLKIDGVTIPDSIKMTGIHADWGAVGAIDSADIVASRAAFDAGDAWTTHPFNIHVLKVRGGLLSRAKAGVDTGSHGIRLSGVHGVKVEDVEFKQTTYALARVTAGDPGYEFAPPAIKHLALKGIRMEGIRGQSTTNSWAGYFDSFADNVHRAIADHGYVPLIDPLIKTDIRVRSLVAKGNGILGITPGLLLIQQRGGGFTDIDLSGYQHGALVDERVDNIKLHGHFHGNRGHGIYGHHGAFKPEFVHVLPGTLCELNGQDAGFENPSGIMLESCRGWHIDGVDLGSRGGETSQENGIRVAAGAEEAVIENCKVHGVSPGGIAYAILESTSYNKVVLFRNNTIDPSITEAPTSGTAYAGVNIIQIARFDGGIGHYLASRASLAADTTPLAGSFVAGSIIFFRDPTATATGSKCILGGTPGTWEQL